MADFTQAIRKLTTDVKQAMEEQSASAYERVDAIIQELDVVLRESMQKSTANEMKRIIQVLRAGKEVGPQDKDLIRLWVIGDAESYAQMENSAEEWRSELVQVMSNIDTFAGKDLDAKGIVRLRALLQDANQTLSDIFYFTEQKERVGRFVDSVREIDAEERELLANILEQKLKLEQF